MLKIFISEKDQNDWHLLYLPTDLSFTYKLSNPAISTIGDFSYPITVSYELNKHIFKFPADGETTDREFEFKLYYGEELFVSGIVEIVNADGIEISLQSGNSAVSTVLATSYLDGTINGQSWGTVSISDFVDTLGGCYPEFDFVATPVRATDNYIFNKRTYAQNEITEGTLCPGIYVRYLIDRIINALGYVKESDAMDYFPDLNRLYFFAARVPGATENYCDWMPHITAFDFLESIRLRFGFYIHFNPVSLRASVKSINDFLVDNPIDLTSKLAEITDQDPYRRKTILLSNEDASDDDDLTEIGGLSVSVYNSFDDLPDLNPETVDYSGNDTSENVYAGVQQDELQNVRIFKKTEVEGSGTLAYLQKTTDLSSDNTYYDITSTEPDDDESSIEKTSDVSSSTNLHLISQFFIPPEVHSSFDEIKSCAIQIDVKKNANDAILVAVLSSPVSVIPLVHVSLTVTNTEYETKKLFSRAMFTPEFNKIGLRTAFTSYILRLYSYSESETNTLTIRFGGTTTSSGVGSIPACVQLNPSFYEWKEIGKVGDFRIGDDDEADEEINASGMVMTNVYGQMYGLFEMPYFPGSADAEQDKYGFSIYRGLRKEIKMTDLESVLGSYDRQEGYSSFDNKTIDQDSPVLENGEPDATLTLRWREQTGIANTLLDKYLFNKRYRFRATTATLNLSFFDLLTLDITRPILLNSHRYIISELSVPIPNSGIGAVTAELVTL